MLRESQLTRMFDLLIASFAIICLSPVFISVALFLAVNGEGEIFFRQARAGKDGKEFKIWKFSTMTKDSANLKGGLFTDLNDPRILFGGRILRQSKLNELPQLFNVLSGQMSLVGWRPLVNTTFETAIQLCQPGTYSKTPGITSLSSILSRNEEGQLARLHGSDKEAYYFNVLLPKKVALDDWWATNASVPRYFGILFLTAWVIAFPNSNAPIRILGGSVSNLARLGPGPTEKHH